MKKIIPVAVIIGVLIKLFVFDILIVSGDSMFPAIADRETLFVNRFAYGIALPFSAKRFCTFKAPKTDDIVIYFYDNKQVVKRIYGVSGDAIEYSQKSVYNEDIEYSLVVNGKTVPLTESQFLRLKDVGNVPEGYVLAIGDNFNVSVDSRTYGFVSEKNILGKILWK